MESYLKKWLNKKKLPDILESFSSVANGLVSQY